VGEEIHLRFWQWFSFTSGDYGQVQISVYNTSIGIWDNWQNVGIPIVETSSLWSLADRELTQYAGKKIRLAFTQNSDWIAVSTGWYIDDVEIILPSSISVNSPNGAEVWQAGTTQKIKWTYTRNPGSQVNIELMKGGIYINLISSSVPIGNSGSGSYDWSIATIQTPGTDYKVRITSSSNPGYTDNSNSNFAIISQVPTPTPTPTPTILISTDKSSYKTGNRMIVGLNLTNSGAITTVKASIWVDMPGGSKHMVMDKPSLSLSAGLKYSKKFPITLPKIPSGDYAWHAVLKNSKNEIISESIAPWTFTGTQVAVESFETVLDNVVIDIE
jgi:hypothetical protein